MTTIHIKHYYYNYKGSFYFYYHSLNNNLEEELHNIILTRFASLAVKNVKLSYFTISSTPYFYSGFFYNIF